MEQYRRYGRWLKRAAIFLVAYIAIAYFFMGVSPGQALGDPGATLAQYRGLVIYLIFIMSFVVLQFVAMFWFLARSNSYVIYPNEYDVTFDDVSGAMPGSSSVFGPGGDGNGSGGNGRRGSVGDEPPARPDPS